MKSGHANRGKSFESALEWQHNIYRASGFVCQKLPTPYKVLGTIPGGLRVVPETVALPDYLVVAHGVSYLVDAKSTESQRWPLAKLTAHQADSFTTWERQGPTHRAGLVLRLGDQTTWWVPWAVLSPAWRAWANGEAKHGEASLSMDWLAANGKAVRGADWLAAAM